MVKMQQITSTFSKIFQAGPCLMLWPMTDRCDSYQSQGDGLIGQCLWG